MTFFSVPISDFGFRISDFRFPIPVPYPLSPIPFYLHNTDPLTTSRVISRAFWRASSIVPPRARDTPMRR
jgi:hypothetical protein